MSRLLRDARQIIAKMVGVRIENRGHRCALVSLIFLFATGAAQAQQVFNTAYVEVNDNALANAGCYLLSNDRVPFFDMAAIFAANINGDDPNDPQIHFNPQVSHLLNQTRQVEELQSKGIKVVLTLLGNHQNAGWSCITQPGAADKFAARIAGVVQTYGLDGIDIDDEYSKCRSNSTSMLMIVDALARNPGFSGKILSKALFRDQDVFRATYNNRQLADFLDYGWEMSYGYPDLAARLQPYLNHGMSKDSLAIGISVRNPPAVGVTLADNAIRNGIGGVMVYNVSRDSRAYLSEISRIEFGQDVVVAANCLR
jgi:hypothetical protein